MNDGPRIAVVGSVNLDLVAFCRRLPWPGETIEALEFERVPGGKGANQAVAAARLGADVWFVGCVGDDDHGRLALAGLEEAGVDLSGVQMVDEPTGVAFVVVGEDAQNQIVVVPGANRRLEARSFDVGDADAVLCQLEIPLETVAWTAERASGLMCLNAAPAREVPERILERCDLIVANSLELDALGSSPLGPLFALTLGSDGALLLEGGEEVARATPPAVRAVDGTAAGDAFCAALVLALLEGRPRQEALERACAAGALAASRPGAQPSLPTAAEVDALLAA